MKMQINLALLYLDTNELTHDYNYWKHLYLRIDYFYKI